MTVNEAKSVYDLSSKPRCIDDMIGVFEVHLIGVKSLPGHYKCIHKTGENTAEGFNTLIIPSIKQVKSIPENVYGVNKKWGLAHFYVRSNNDCVIFDYDHPKNKFMGYVKDFMRVYYPENPISSEDRIHYIGFLQLEHFEDYKVYFTLKRGFEKEYGLGK